MAYQIEVVKGGKFNYVACRFVNPRSCFRSGGKMSGSIDSFETQSVLHTQNGPISCYDVGRLDRAGFTRIHQLPFSIKILLENLLRHENGETITADHIGHLARWSCAGNGNSEVPFMPARILLQDFTGVPAIADIAAMRDAAMRLYGDPMKVKLRIPADLVVDHSVQVDCFASTDALKNNMEKEFVRNAERYAFLRWGHASFKNLRVIPPGTGIVHQVNLEYLAKIVFVHDTPAGRMAFPDTVVGLDSHTTMINGAGVLGWGVGGIEAEAVMLGKPYYLIPPRVIGLKLTGEMPQTATATDLVLTLTELLRKKGVVGQFIEFFGEGLCRLHLEDRATIANMAPEYGATIGFFPVDEETLRYLRITGRKPEHVDLIERYLKAQGLFRTPDTPDPEFSEIVCFDMGDVQPCLAGPSRPQQRILLSRMSRAFTESTKDACEIGQITPDSLSGDAPFWEDEGGAFAGGSASDPDSSECGFPESRGVVVRLINGKEFKLFHGSVIIAAIASCTNTSNPFVMVQAGLLAKKAVLRGLTPKPWVKTSLTPGSRVVTDYLIDAGLMQYLEKLGFHSVAYGCATCIGNSGPIEAPIARAITENHLVAAAVLSGNRNFGGRISPVTASNYLASPPLVVAYALAGNIGIDFDRQPLGYDPDGRPVYLKDIWPTSGEVRDTVAAHLLPEMFNRAYQDVFEGPDIWKSIDAPAEGRFAWNSDSTYIKPPPFFDSVSEDVPGLADIRGARVLALLGDGVTTDHISPAGAIAKDSPAGRYLTDRGIPPHEFNSFGSRRGNHDIMMRGTFGSIRLRNRLVSDMTGGWTRYFPEGKVMSIYDAAMTYKDAHTPLIVIAGKDYGTGSSRDWAAKGVKLLGVKAVIAESFERIHRSNLICMGVLPLQFKPGECHETLNLDGTETYDIAGIEKDFKPGKELLVRAETPDGKTIAFSAIARIDAPVELTYYQHGGILPFVLRTLESC
jgi:aconitate hydratase